MGRKIFISYKYSDIQVRMLPQRSLHSLLGLGGPTKVRDYVDKLQNLLNADDHINKGEQDGEDLSHFKNETIASRLRNKIFDSSITIVLISKGMKNNELPQEDQWIPWEISYSLKETIREDRIGRSNAILAIVIPDENNKYNYYIEVGLCPYCNCRTLNTHILFDILKRNMFNIKTPEYGTCLNHGLEAVYTGESSYIQSVLWDDFIKNPNSYIEKSLEIRNNIENYKITKIAPRLSLLGLAGYK